MKTHDIPICAWCDEIVEGDAHWIPHVTKEGAEKRPYHPDCMVRSVIGGLNHLQMKCKCYGGSLPNDPPHLTKREAAAAAVAEWRSRRRWGTR